LETTRPGNGVGRVAGSKPLDDLTEKLGALVRVLCRESVLEEQGGPVRVYWRSGLMRSAAQRKETRNPPRGPFALSDGLGLPPSDHPICEHAGAEARHKRKTQQGNSSDSAHRRLLAIGEDVCRSYKVPKGCRARDRIESEYRQRKAPPRRR
jgi:hypothetical protein